MACLSLAVSSAPGRRGRRTGRVGQGGSRPAVVRDRGRPAMFAPLAVAARTGWPHSLHVGGGEVTVSRPFRPVVGQLPDGILRTRQPPGEGQEGPSDRAGARFDGQPADENDPAATRGRAGGGMSAEPHIRTGLLERSSESHAVESPANTNAMPRNCFSVNRGRPRNGRP